MSNGKSQQRRVADKVEAGIDEKATVVATNAGGTVVPVGLPLDELAADAGKGLENVKGADLALPFLIILQANSPQCKRSEGAYIPGAQEGMLFNTLTRQLFDGADVGVEVIPVFYDRVLLEWRPNRGGLTGVHPVTSDILSKAKRNEKNKDVLPSGNHIASTAQHYCLLKVDDVSWQPVVIAMSSTQLKKSRRWNSMMASQKMRHNDKEFTPPAYSQIYRLKTVPESNESGAWMGWSMELQGYVSDRATFETAKALHKTVSEGRVSVRHDDLSDQVGAGVTTQTAEDLGGDEIPF